MPPFLTPVFIAHGREPRKICDNQASKSNQNGDQCSIDITTTAGFRQSTGKNDVFTSK